MANQGSGLSVHFKKHKGNVSGLGRHNERRADDGVNHSNKGIDSSRTHLNEFVLDPKGRSLDARINGRIEEGYTSNRKIRDNTVKDVEASIMLSGDIVERGTHEQQRKAIMLVHDYLCDYFGKDNNIASVIHNDEATQHMHDDFVPLKSVINKKTGEKETTLSAKTLLTKGTLKKIQRDTLKILQDNFPEFDFERSDNNELSGMDGKAFKAYMAGKEELDAREKAVAEKEGKAKDMEEKASQKLLEARERLSKVQGREKAVKALEREFNANKDERDALTNEIGQLQHQKQFEETALSLVQQNKKDLSDENNELTKSNQSLKDENEQWSSMNDAMAQAVAKQQEDFDKQVEAKEQQIADEVKAEEERLKSERETLAQQRRDLEADQDKLADERNAFETGKPEWIKKKTKELTKSITEEVQRKWTKGMKVFTDLYTYMFKTEDTLKEQNKLQEAKQAHEDNKTIHNSVIRKGMDQDLEVKPDNLADYGKAADKARRNTTTYKNDQNEVFNQLNDMTEDSFDGLSSDDALKKEINKKNQL